MAKSTRKVCGKIGPKGFYYVNTIHFKWTKKEVVNTQITVIATY